MEKLNQLSVMDTLAKNDQLLHEMVHEMDAINSEVDVKEIKNHLLKAHEVIHDVSYNYSLTKH